MRHMLGFLTALLLTLSVSSSQAQTEKSVDVSVNLEAGNEKGFSDRSELVNGQRWFYAGKTVVLKLPEPGLAKWEQFRAKLGPAYKVKPSLFCKSADGKPGIIYRFKGGILTRHGNQAYYTSWKLARVWWPRSGLREQPWPTPTKNPSQT